VLVNDLLDVSRIEAGQVSLNLAPLQIASIAGEVIAEVQRRSHEENKPMDFRLDAQAGLPPALGDLERIRQVLNNLVSNAYNYTPAHGRVTVTVRQQENQIRVDVRDNGVGIAPDAQHRIFERFYRGEDPLVLATAGTGLGLAIARTMVEMHHGRIWFESSGKSGEGSVFSFTLPVDEGQE
jgi:signal transduction histidine kinase